MYGTGFAFCRRKPWEHFTVRKETTDATLVEIDQDHATVQTEIVREHDLPVAVEYHLLHKEGDWKVYDIVIEGARLLCFGWQEANRHLAITIDCLANNEVKRSSARCPSSRHL